MLGKYVLPDPCNAVYCSGSILDAIYDQDRAEREGRAWISSQLGSL
jgi:hypothetical protein